MSQFLRRQWFLLALLLVLLAGFNAAEWFAGFANTFPTKFLVAFVLFLMAWTLDASDMWRAIRDPRAAVLGVLINFAFLPLLAFALSRLLPHPLDVGLILAAAVPCTLASAAVWTRRAGGNDAVALLVTVVTNSTCFVVTPLLLRTIAGEAANMKKSLAEMILDLALIVVLPMVLGQLLRLLRPLARWASDQKVLVSGVAQIGILTMILIGATKSSISMAEADALGNSIGVGGWIGMLLAVVALHCAALLFGFVAGRAIGLARSEWIAVGFAGSQKTLMIGIHIAVANELGVGLLPMVAYHAVQLLIDTVVADRLKKTAPEESQAV